MQLLVIGPNSTCKLQPVHVVVMTLPASSASTADRYISLILNQSESLGVLHQEQIRRNQERLQETIAEFERLRTAETKRLEESVQTLDQKFQKMLTKLQEEFVILAYEASEQFKTGVRNCTRQYEKKLENRARELALELQSASFNSDMLRQARDNVEVAARLQSPQLSANSDHNGASDREVRNKYLGCLPTVPEEQDLDIQWLTGSQPKMKRSDPQQHDNDDTYNSRQPKLNTAITSKENTDHYDENFRNQTTGIGCRSTSATLKPSITERHALTARRQFPEFKTKEIAFVKGRLRALMQSMEKLDQDSNL